MTKKEKNDAFDIEKALDELEHPKMLVDGFKAYIESNNLKVKSEKEFEKLFKEFGELSL